jgi:hypothetical protein
MDISLLIYLNHAIDSCQDKVKFVGNNIYNNYGISYI